MTSLTRGFAAAFALSAILTGRAQSDALPPATHGYESGPAGIEGTLMARMDELGLSAVQRDALQKIAERYRVRAADLAQRASGIREQLLDVLPGDPAYARATAAAGETAAVLAADGVRLLSDMRAEAYAVLSPEQRQRARDLLTGERSRWDDWRARHKAAP